MRLIAFLVTFSLAINGIAQFSGGNGSSSDPYQVSSLTELRAMDSTAYISSHFILINDIDASATSTISFQPIGLNGTFSFAGSLNGQGYIISNLTIDRVGQYNGLFTRTNGASIRNLGLVNVNVNPTVSRQAHNGGLVGLVQGSGNLIENCFVTGNIRGVSYNGLIIAEDIGSLVLNKCYAIGNVSGVDYHNGGLVGRLSGTSTVSNSFAMATVTGKGPSTSSIIGHAYTGATFSNLYYNTDTSSLAAIDNGPAMTGYNTADMKIQGSFAFDFNNSWSISPLINKGYPYLSAVLPLEGNIWNGSSWSDGTPNASTLVANIRSSLTPNANFTAANIFIKSGVALDISNRTATVNGIVVNHGDGLSGPGTIVFDNSGGNTELLANAISFEGVVEVTSGTTLLSNDNLTLAASSPTGYGMLTGTGTVSGNVTVEQYVDLPTAVAGVDGRWIEIAANVTAPLTDWNEGSSIMVASAGSQGTVWQYNAYTGAWGAPSDINNNAELGRGYSVYAGTNNFGTFLRSGDGTIDLAGAANTSDLPITLQYNAGSSTFDTEGWNLIGNPFAAQYDWSQQTIPAGLNDAIYIWDGQLDRYATYVGTTGNNGGTQYIAPGQGFWVKTTTGPISFTFAANNRVTSESTTLFKTTPDIIRLKAGEEGATIQDELIVGFDAAASYNFDGNLDAQKRYNGSSVPNFFSVISGIDYAINRIPANGTYDSIPLALQYAPQGVKMEIIANAQDLQAYTYVELRDAKTGQAIDLKAQTTYQFANDTNMVEGRFSLHFNNHNVSLKENQATEDNWFAYQGATGLMVSFDEKLMGETLVIHNISGIQVAEMEISQRDMAILQSQPRGVYFLRLKGHESKVQKVIQQ